MPKSGASGPNCANFLILGDNFQANVPNSNIHFGVIAFLHLTQCTIGRQDTVVMQIHTRLLAAAAIGSALFLTACKQETISGDAPDPDAAALNAAKPVELPPMVTQSRTYRCKDSSLVFVEFFSNNTAVYRASKGGAGTTLTAAEPGKPYAADGYSVSGDGPQVTIAAPGKPSQDCKA